MIEIRRKNRSEILEKMYRIKLDMESLDQDSLTYKKKLGEYLYLHTELRGLEKLAYNEYGVYLWRQYHHLEFLKDRLKKLVSEKNNLENKKLIRKEIKSIIKEIRHTQEYGYDYRKDNRDRPNGL